MNRKFKMLGLAFVAVLAMSAVAANAAQALSFTTNSHNVTISGEQTAGNTHVFTYQGRPITCAEVKFDPVGTYSTSVTAVEVTPTYSNCHAVILGNTLPVTVTHNECTFQFTVGGSLSGNSAHIKCPAGKKIQIHVYEDKAHSKQICTYEVGIQTVGSVTFSNMPHTGSPPSTTPADITVTTNSNVHTVRVFGNLVPCGPATSIATYVSERTTVRAEAEGVPVNIDVG